MSEQALSKLTPEQVEALNDEQKAVFCILDEFDQKFFAQTFAPKDLPGALTRKGEIIKRNQSDQEYMDQLKAYFALSPQEAQPSENKSGDILTAVGAAVGVGAAAALVATDSTASWRGVRPGDFVPPLRNEFNNDQTQIDVAGDPQKALTVTVQIISDHDLVPALTIGLSAEGDSTKVKVSDLSSRGTLETLKAGGKKLLGIAASGVRILTQSKFGGVSPADLINTANRTLSEGADLAEVAGNLKLRDRAWKVIKQAGETIEASYLSQLDQERQARFALEKAWDNYYNCPTCGVSFQPEEKTCRVCASARPEPPVKPDPRML